MTDGMQAEKKTFETETSGSLSLAELVAPGAAHTRTMTVRAIQKHAEDAEGKVTEE